MTDLELTNMDKGTEARMNCTFHEWAYDEQQEYWKLVDKFNEERPELKYIRA